MLGETKNQFSLTRAALSTGGRAKSNFLSLISVNKTYYNDQSYCEKDADCIEQMSNCKLPEGILNCRNIYFKKDSYYKLPQAINCEKLNISEVDKCLCNTQINRCEIIQG